MFLLVCNVYLLITDANILLLYDSGLNLEHLTKEKKGFFSGILWKIALLGSPKIDI